VLRQRPCGAPLHGMQPPDPATTLVVRIVPTRHFLGTSQAAHLIDFLMFQSTLVHTVVVHRRRLVQKADFVQIRYANRPYVHDQEYLMTSAMLLSLLFTRSIYAAPRLMNGNARRRWEYQSIGPKQRESPNSRNEGTALRPEMRRPNPNPKVVLVLFLPQ
jgi:hypothetical protein